MAVPPPSPKGVAVEYAVLTRVKVRPGSIDGLAELFDATNRALVAGHDDWLGAWFTANRAESEVTVIARWRDADSYERLRSDPQFELTMALFAEEFTGPPSVSINELLVDM
jgi:quinol monooxygenase YgiN